MFLAGAEEIMVAASPTMHWKKSSTAEKYLNIMEESIGILNELDYPDALTGGLRRYADNARSIIASVAFASISSGLSPCDSSIDSLIAPSPKKGFGGKQKMYQQLIHPRLKILFFVYQP